MSTALNALHPVLLFIQKRLGTQFVMSLQITMPPNSNVTMAVAPPAGYIWVLIGSASSPVRDVATNNPIITPLVYVYFRHSMIRGMNFAAAFESLFNFPYPMEVDIRANDPLVGTVVNGTALTITFNVTLAMMETIVDRYEQYLALWEGVYNLERILGGLSDTDVANIVNLFKRFGSPVVPLGTLVTEEEASPTMSEDIDGITRLRIP